MTTILADAYWIPRITPRCVIPPQIGSAPDLPLTIGKFGSQAAYLIFDSGAPSLCEAGHVNAHHCVGLLLVDIQQRAEQRGNFLTRLGTRRDGRHLRPPVHCCRDGFVNAKPRTQFVGVYVGSAWIVHAVILTAANLAQ
jgi:hypothetical protein